MKLNMDALLQKKKKGKENLTKPQNHKENHNFHT